MRYIHKVDVITTLRYLGVIMIAIGIMNLIPIIVDLIYLESNYISYLIGGLISIILGFVLYKWLERRCGPLKLKHAMMVSALGWIWAGISGAIVMALCLRFGLLDGILENISALTASVKTSTHLCASQAGIKFLFFLVISRILTCSRSTSVLSEKYLSQERMWELLKRLSAILFTPPFKYFK